VFDKLNQVLEKQDAKVCVNGLEMGQVKTHWWAPVNRMLKSIFHKEGISSMIELQSTVKISVTDVAFYLLSKLTYSIDME
jgi:hypothetical protein